MSKTKRGLSNLLIQQMYGCFKKSVMFDVSKTNEKLPWEKRAKIHKARAKLVLANLFTGGLVNLYYKFLIVPNSAKEKNVRKFKDQNKLQFSITNFAEVVQKRGDTGLKADELRRWLDYVFGIGTLPEVSQEFEQGWDRFLQNEAYVSKLNGLASEFPFAI